MKGPPGVERFGPQVRAGGTTTSGVSTLFGAVMPRVAEVGFVLGLLVAVLGLVVAVCGYMNAGHYADLDATARQFGDDGTGASRCSFVTGIVLLAIGVISAAVSALPTEPARTPRPAGRSRRT